MAVEQNKVSAKRVFEEVWNKGNLNVLDELMLPTVTIHNLPPELPHGIEGYKQFFKMYRTAFPDLHFTVDDEIAEEDKVAVRWTSTGTHKGPLPLVKQLTPTNKKGTITGMTMLRYDAKGKVVETWIEFDELHLLQQIGAFPVPV